MPSLKTSYSLQLKMSQRSSCLVGATGQERFTILTVKLAKYSTTRFNRTSQENLSSILSLKVDSPRPRRMSQFRARWWRSRRPRAWCSHLRLKSTEWSKSCRRSPLQTLRRSRSQCKCKSTPRGARVAWRVEGKCQASVALGIQTQYQCRIWATGVQISSRTRTSHRLSRSIPCLPRLWSTLWGI